jgi:hypothetical protein
MPDIYQKVDDYKKTKSSLLRELKATESELLANLTKVQSAISDITGQPVGSDTEHDKIIDSLIPAKKTKGKRKASPEGGETGNGRAKRTISESHRQAIRAAQTARWAKKKGKTAATPKEPKTAKKKGGMSPEGKARIAAAQKARWAKVRAAKNKK